MINQPKAALFVFEKETLAMAARQMPAGCRSLGDGKDRRMGDGLMSNTERIEAPEQLFRCERHSRHSCHDADRRSRRQAPSAITLGRKSCKVAAPDYHARRMDAARSGCDAGVAQG
jgi:hypothetical protein